MPYALKLKNITGYNEECFYCGDKKCDGCPVPFLSDETYENLLKKVGVTSN